MCVVLLFLRSSVLLEHSQILTVVIELRSADSTSVCIVLVLVDSSLVGCFPSIYPLSGLFSLRYYLVLSITPVCEAYRRRRLCSNSEIKERLSSFLFLFVRDCNRCIVKTAKKKRSAN